MAILIALLLSTIGLAQAEVSDYLPHGIGHVIRCSATTNDGLSLAAYGFGVAENKYFGKTKKFFKNGEQGCLLLSVKVEKNYYTSVKLDVFTQIGSLENGKCYAVATPFYMSVPLYVTTSASVSDPAFGTVSCWKL